MAEVSSSVATRIMMCGEPVFASGAVFLPETWGPAPGSDLPFADLPFLNSLIEKASEGPGTVCHEYPTCLVGARGEN